MNLHDSLIFWGKLGSFCFNLIPLSFFLFWSNLIPLSINHLGIRQSLRLQPLLCSSIPFNLFFYTLIAAKQALYQKQGLFLISLIHQRWRRLLLKVTHSWRLQRGCSRFTWRALPRPKTSWNSRFSCRCTFCIFSTLKTYLLLFMFLNQFFPTIKL